jgi:hypothetical protein
VQDVQDVQHDSELWRVTRLAQGDGATSKHIYEVCPRKDKRGVDLISDRLQFGTTDDVSGQYRSVNKFDAPKSTHAGVSKANLAGIGIAHFFL